MFWKKLPCFSSGNGKQNDCGSKQTEMIGERNHSGNQSRNRTHEIDIFFYDFPSIYRESLQFAALNFADLQFAFFLNPQNARILQ